MEKFKWKFEGREEIHEAESLAQLETELNRLRQRYGLHYNHPIEIVPEYVIIDTSISNSDKKFEPLPKNTKGHKYTNRKKPR